MENKTAKLSLTKLFSLTTWKKSKIFLSSKLFNWYGLIVATDREQGAWGGVGGRFYRISVKGIQPKEMNVLMVSDSLLCGGRIVDSPDIVAKHCTPYKNRIQLWVHYENCMIWIKNMLAYG